jgi:hypothetical protein
VRLPGASDPIDTLMDPLPVSCLQPAPDIDVGEPQINGLSTPKFGRDLFAANEKTPNF